MKTQAACPVRNRNPTRNRNLEPNTIHSDRKSGEWITITITITIKSQRNDYHGRGAGERTKSGSLQQKVPKKRVHVPHSVQSVTVLHFWQDFRTSILQRCAAAPAQRGDRRVRRRRTCVRFPLRWLRLCRATFLCDLLLNTLPVGSFLTEGRKDTQRGESATKGLFTGGSRGSREYSF